MKSFDKTTKDTVHRQQEQLSPQAKVCTIDGQPVRKKELKKAIAIAKITKLAGKLTKKKKGRKSPKSGGKTDGKIILSVSVDLIALAIRVFLVAGIIRETNLSKVSRIICGAFKTEEQDNISVGSFRSKMYNIETSNKEKLIEILENLIAAIKTL